MDALPLSQFAVISVAGTDRRSFLQGQLTQDLNQLSPSQALLTGWTNPQGRLLLIGQLMERHDDILIVVPRELTDGIVMRLRMFILRASIVIDVAPMAVYGLHRLPKNHETTVLDLSLDAHPQASNHQGGTVVARLAGDSSRALLLGEKQHLARALATSELLTASDAEWQLMNIDQGIPSVTTKTSEAFVPQMVNLDLLDGISFSKGCYVGQEIIARTQNLGRIKRRMFRLASANNPHLAAGDSLLTSDDKNAGRVVAATTLAGGARLLAVIQLTNIDKPLFDGRKMPLELLPLPYDIPLAN